MLVWRKRTLSESCLRLVHLIQLLIARNAYKIRSSYVHLLVSEQHTHTSR
jgi:hypothetical protein